MAFFDELGKKISQTTQDVVQKTKDTTESMKLNNMISDEEKRIKKIYTEIGQAYFELHAENCEDSFKGYIDGIKDAKSKIKDYSEQVKRLKGIKPCPNCGSDVAPNVPFCATCGFRIIVPNVNPVVNAIPHCTNCGAPINPGSAFCTNCGKKAEVAMPPQPTPPVQPAVPTPPVQPVVPVPPMQPTVPVQPAAPAPAAPSVKVCPNCGKELSSGMKFCTGCGTRIEN